MQDKANINGVDFSKGQLEDLVGCFQHPGWQQFMRLTANVQRESVERVLSVRNPLSLAVVTDLLQSQGEFGFIEDLKLFPSQASDQLCAWEEKLRANTQ